MEATISNQNISASANTDETVNTQSEVTYHRQISVSAIVTLLTAFAVVFATQYIENTSSSLYIFLISLASVLVIAGLIKLFTGKRKITYNKTGSPVRNRQYFFAAKELGGILGALDRKEFARLNGMEKIDTDKNGVKLDVFLSEDKRYANIHVYEFVPFSYRLVSTATLYDDDAAGVGVVLPVTGK